MKTSCRALLILTCYDFESLQLTLKSIEHTLDENEKVVIILNGINTRASALVERISRAWANASPANRFVVRPLCSGAKAFFAIKEVLENYQPLAGVTHICKIDDDIIPLKRNWLDSLALGYTELSKATKVGFTTGLINNNCWGFNELLDIYDKRKEYETMFNYKTRGGAADKFKAGEVNNGFYGTIWQEPYLGWWIHQWTTLQIESFIAKTASLPPVEIPPETGYSIGCLFFEKQFWLDLDHEKYQSMLDEEIIHFTCQNEKREKWAFMNEPMIHLFYFNQRIPNRDILEAVTESLSRHFNDFSFQSLVRINPEELMINLNESFKTLSDDFMSFLKSLVTEPDMDQA